MSSNCLGSLKDRLRRSRTDWFRLDKWWIRFHCLQYKQISPPHFTTKLWNESNGI